MIEFTNDEFERKWTDLNNVRIIRAASESYRHLLPPDILENCGLHGLYRCLQTHDDSLGGLFTSSLTYHVIWQCKQAMVEHNRFCSTALTVDCVDDAPPPLLNIMVEECLDILPERDRAMVVARYLESSSFQEIATQFDCTRSGAKYIIDRSLEKMRKTAKNGV